jgi:hypothetical protein
MPPNSLLDKAFVSEYLLDMRVLGLLPVPRGSRIGEEVKFSKPLSLSTVTLNPGGVNP